MLNRIAIVSLIIFSLTAFAFADAGPEPGYVRVGVPLIITPQDNFPGYRFFLNSPGGIEEIKLAKGKTTTIPTTGRAGTMKYTMLIAVPEANLSAYEGPAALEKLQALKQAIGDGKIEGVIEVLSHDFDAYVTKREKRTWKNSVYILKASADKKIEAVETRPGGKTKAGIDGEEENPHLATNIAAGSLLSLSFIFGGVWFARRRKRA